MPLPAVKPRHLMRMASSTDSCRSAPDFSARADCRHFDDASLSSGRLCSVRTVFRGGRFQRNSPALRRRVPWSRDALLSANGCVVRRDWRPSTESASASARQPTAHRYAFRRFRQSCAASHLDACSATVHKSAVATSRFAGWGRCSQIEVDDADNHFPGGYINAICFQWPAPCASSESCALWILCISGNLAAALSRQPRRQ